MFSLICWTAYLLSAVAVVVISFKITEVRSACTHEKAKITRTVAKIRELKEENNRLTATYYGLLCPELVDKNSKALKFLKENEVKYLK